MSSKYEDTVIKEDEKTLIYYKWCMSFFTSENASKSKEQIQPLYIESITKVNDYNNANLPVMIARARMSLADVMKLKKWEKKCMVGIDCYMYTMLHNANTNNYDEYDSKLLISATYMPIFNESTFKMKYNESDIETKDEDETNKSEGTTDDIQQVTVSMLLLHVTAQNALKKMFNEVVAPGSDIPSVLSWVLSELDVEGIIVDQPDNISEYSGNEIIIPPMAAIQCLNYLQSMYGIYSNGLRIFYDVCKIGNNNSKGILYVLDKYATEHDIVEDTPEITYIQVEDPMNSTGLVIRRLIKDGKNPEYVGVIPIEKTSNEVLDGELTSHDMVFSSFNQGIDATVFTNQEVDSSNSHGTALSISRNSKTSEVSDGRTYADYDELNNIYNVSSYYNSIEAMSQKFSFILENCLITDFMPNMFVNFAFNDVKRNSEYAGNYFINKASYNFMRIPEGDYLIGSSSDELDDGKHYTVTSCKGMIEVSRRNPDTLDAINS